MNWIGRVVAERYRLTEVVGHGGHSLIYRAVERGGDREVAIKVLHEGLAHHEELEARMCREFETLTRLEGTSATKAYELCRAEGTLCLVMELLRGQDLDLFLEDTEAQGLVMQVPTLVEFLGPIVETLKTAHGRGILHRDLKPGNIFVLGRGGPGGVRLLDFGLAWSESSVPITRDGTVLGSPSYIAPEVWEGKPRALDVRVDVYALGAIVFRALAGRVPFPTSGLREKIEAARVAPRPSLHAVRPDLPSSVDPWVAQVLAADRRDRFSSVVSAWSAFLSAVGAESA